MRNQVRKKRKRANYLVVFVAILFLPHILTIGQTKDKHIKVARISGYCIYTFSYDSVFQSYYPLKSQFIDSVHLGEYSIIKRSNLEEYSKTCFNIDLSAIGETNLYYDKYTIIHDSGFVNTYLEGKFYLDVRTGNTIAAFKVEGIGLILSKPCKKYLRNFRFNNYQKKVSTICHDFLKPPQIFINKVFKTSVPTAIEQDKLHLKEIEMEKIRYYICI